MAEGKGPEAGSIGWRDLTEMSAAEIAQGDLGQRTPALDAVVDLV